MVMIAKWHNGDKNSGMEAKASLTKTSDAILKLPFFNPIKSDP